LCEVEKNRLICVKSLRKMVAGRMQGLSTLDIST